MLLLNILYDIEGNFQWSSVVAVVALLSSIITLIGVIINSRTLKRNNEKNIKFQENASKKTLALQKELHEKSFQGNVVATSRIQWIQEVREHSVAFITSYYNLVQYVRDLD